jgi:hypothetical protein
VIKVAAKPLPAAHPARNGLMQRVEGDGQNQGPDHQHHERREDPVAQQYQRQDQPGAYQRIEHPHLDRGFLWFLCFLVGTRALVHG